MSNKQSRTNQRKKRVLKRRFKILIPILIVFLAVGLYFGNLYLQASTTADKIYDDESQEKSDKRDSKPDPKLDNISILLMGIDSSDTRGADDAARTDALMVATLNEKEKSVKLLSIPRDSRVYVEEIDRETKINEAHHYGGPRATRKTVESLLDIPIDYYLRINFEAFMEVVDILGGVTVDVPYEFREQNSKDQPNAIHLYEGTQELDGEEALAFARTRKKDSDIERGKRQQEIIKALFKKSLSPSSIFKYDDVIVAMGDNMKTSMRFSEMKSLFGYLTEGSNLNIETLTLEGEDFYIPGQKYYFDLDERSVAKTANILQDHLDIPLTDFGFDDLDDEDNDLDDTTEQAQGYSGS